MYYNYIIQSLKDKDFYTGCTNDLKERFEKHNKGLISSTKNRGPFKIIYYEACINKEDAFQREKYLKTGMGKRYIQNRIKKFLIGNEGAYI